MKYQIRVEGRIDSLWSTWFEGMAIEYDGHSTILTGPVNDQSQLHGMLHRIRDLNLTIISLNQVEDKREKQTDKEDNQ